jgi:hypothetical protein
VPLSGVGVRCGKFGTSNSTNEEYLVRQVQQPLVLTVDGKQIDEQRTRQLFAAPGLGGRPAGASAAEDSASLGYNFSIFKYKDRYYFDVFRHDPFDAYGDFLGRRAVNHIFVDRYRKAKDDPAIANTLGVFLREHGKTRQVCEYHMTSEERAVK